MHIISDTESKIKIKDVDHKKNTMKTESRK